MEWSVRAFVALCFVLSLTTSSLAGVTEVDAIRLFLETSPQARAVAVAETSAGATVKLDAVLPNPEVAYGREDAAGTAESFLTVEQRLPITGRRGLVLDSAEAASRAAGLAAGRELNAETHAMRESFYEVLYHEKTVERLRNGTTLLDALVEILRRREMEGEGSGYDLLRAEQESEEARLETAHAESAVLGARARLGSFFDASSRMEQAELSGDFAISSTIPTVDAALEQALTQRSDLEALETSRERQTLAQRAARRSRFPEPSVTAGWKRAEAAGLSDSGYVVGLSVPLPIFDRGQLEVARVTANQRSLELETEVLRRAIRADVLAAVARERATREAAERYGRDMQRRATELRNIARLRYDEGEGTILELIDAHRTSLTMELRGLAALYEAKRAEIERDRAVGNEVMP